MHIRAKMREKSGKKNEKTPLARLSFINYKPKNKPLFSIYFLHRLKFNVLKHYFYILLRSSSKKGSNLATFFASEKFVCGKSVLFVTIKTDINLNIYTLS